MTKRGVELFFAISGFILGIPFASHYLRGVPRVNLRRYFIRRLTRLEPPYIINLMVLAGILVIVTRTITSIAGARWRLAICSKKPASTSWNPKPISTFGLRGSSRSCSVRSAADGCLKSAAGSMAYSPTWASLPPEVPRSESSQDESKSPRFIPRLLHLVGGRWLFEID